MSYLQHSLHAMPSGSIVTSGMFASNADMNKSINNIVQREVQAAQQFRAETGCSWAEAILAVAG